MIAYLLTHSTVCFPCKRAVPLRSKCKWIETAFRFVVGSNPIVLTSSSLCVSWLFVFQTQGKRLTEGNLGPGPTTQHACHPFTSPFPHVAEIDISEVTYSTLLPNIHKDEIRSDQICCFLKNYFQCLGKSCSLFPWQLNSVWTCP
jgi:hypothetical protein